MDRYIIFMLLVLVLLLLTHVVAFKNFSAVRAYYFGSGWKGPLSGIARFILYAIALFVVLESMHRNYVIADDYQSQWFNYVELFAGVDYTLDNSPMCVDDGPSNRLTSNGGLRLNVHRFAFDRFSISSNAKYQHGSCEFNDDRDSYDGVGAEIVLRWEF